MLVWREEQKPAELGSEEVVDMPHNCAGAESIRLAFLLIAIERDDELHPFQRVPPASIQTEKNISIRGAATLFGPLTVTLSVPDTKILIRVKPFPAPAMDSLSWDEADPLKFTANQAVVRQIEFGPSFASE